MVRIINLFFLNIKLITPWLLKAFLVMFYVVILAVSNLWRSIPLAIDRIAGSLVSEATGKNLPTNLDNTLYWLACSVAVIEIMICWIFLSYATMFVIRLLF